MSNTKKNLLNENTIRRFMKLAEIDTLSDGFVDTLSEMYGTHIDEEEEVEEGMGPAYDRDDDDAGEPLDLPAEEPAEEPAELEEPEMGLEEPAAEGGDAVALSDAVAQLMSVISSMTGVDIDVDDGEEEAELPAEEPAEDDLDMAAAGEEDEDIPGVELEEEFDQEFVVREITRRVTDRLQKESRRDTVADQLSENIIRRIKSQSKK